MIYGVALSFRFRENCFFSLEIDLFHCIDKLLNKAIEIAVLALTLSHFSSFANWFRVLSKQVV